MRRPHIALTVLFASAWLAGIEPRALAEDPHPLTIYFIDVEGGQSTLIVTPERQAMLIDAGYPARADRIERDPDRIMLALADAGISALDYLLITHYHQDHAGGVATISRRVPVGTFLDHGDPVEDDPIYGVNDRRAHDAYEEARGDRPQLHLKAGDRLPLKGLDVILSNGGGLTLEKPVPDGGRPNPACETYLKHDDDPGENASSLGIWLRFGKFRFVDTGDLNWNKLGQLACPRSILGTADVYLVSHHGNLDANVPEFIMGLSPKVAVVNNGVNKGAAPETLETLRQIPSIDSVWQLHLTAREGARNFDPDVVANLTTDTAHWLKVTASRDGSFTVTNARNGYSKSYPPHR